MTTYFEQTVGLDRAEVVAQVLDLQTEAFGYLDVPMLSREFRDFSGGNALDIGTGDGSFLARLAEANTDIQFVGIEHNMEFLDKARSRFDGLELPNVRLKQAFFDSDYAHKHDVILTRFTLQHSSAPQEFIRSAHRSLNLGGMFVCVEPVYAYYDSEPADPMWQGFRDRMLEMYSRWKSNPNVPRQACRWFSEAGFEGVRAAINIYSPATIGQRRFQDVVLATAAMMHKNHPDICDETFLQELEEWIVNPASDPYMSAAHVLGFKPRG